MKKVWITLGLAVVLGALFPLWKGLVFGDIEAIDDSDLVVEFVLPENNAYDILSQLEEGDPFELFALAAEADGYLEPGLIEFDSVDDFFPTLTGFNDAIDRSLDDEEAIENALIVSQMMQEAPGGLIQQLLAMTAKESLLNAIAEQNLQVDLSEFSDNKSGVILAVKVEYMMQAFVVDLTEEVDSSWLNRLHPNRTKAIFAEDARQSIATLDLSCEEELEEVDVGYAPGGIKSLYGINSAGKILIYQLTPRKGGGRDRMCELEALL